MRLLSLGVIAAVRRGQYDYSHDAIQRLINKQCWSRPTNRLCTDKVLLRFVFASRNEVEFEDKFRRAIERLEEEHHDLIHEVQASLSMWEHLYARERARCPATTTTKTTTHTMMKKMQEDKSR
jgi:hypothetical protein